MRVHLGRILALAGVFIFNADTGAKGAEETCKVCQGAGTYWVSCTSDTWGGQSGYTNCTAHYDEYHGYHCDFSGDQCTIPY